MPTKYPDEFRRLIIQRYEKGEPLKKLSDEYHIALSTLYHWNRAYRSVCTSGRICTPVELEKASRHLQKLGHELEIIHLSQCIETVPLKNRLEILEQMHTEYDCYSIHELCEALNVSRGTFYNHILCRADTSQRDAEQAQLMRQVQQIFDDSGQRFGAKKIKVVLDKGGIHVSVKRISEIMKDLDIHSIRTDAKKQYQKEQRTIKKKLLERDFTATAPNQIWVSDFTYFRVNGYWLYFCIILDLYSRKILGHRISRNVSTNLITAMLRQAYEDRGKPINLTIHSDRGKQYTSSTMTKLLQQYGIKQSFSASGQPHDNAVAETFFASFKKEEAYRREYTSEKSYCKSVDHYVFFYNAVRPHQTLKYQTPSAFEDQYFQKSDPSF